MAKLIVVITGPVGAGKSTLSAGLASRFGIHHLRTRDVILKLRPRTSLTRTALQRAGDTLDRETAGAWVANAVYSFAEPLPVDAILVVDSLRTNDQVHTVRRAFGPRVRHIHLKADLPTLKRRHIERQAKTGEAASYDTLRRNRTERQTQELDAVADIVINTHRNTVSDVVVRAAAHLGLYGHSHDRLADILIGGQYGSEGKGAVAAYLAPEYEVLVRVGGPNAGHTVYEEPEPYTHHMLPSGTRRNQDAHLVIGPGAILRVPKLLREIADCELDADRLSIDPQAMIISDDDIRHEDAVKRSIGSTAQGVGAATARKILGRDIPPDLARDIPDLAPYIRDSAAVLDEAFRCGKRVLLEGTQGTALSIHHGSYPYVTSRDTTVSGCLAEAGIAPTRVRRVIMVCRTYPIRVQSPEGQTSGPMGTELTFEDIAERSGLDVAELIAKEVTSTTRRRRRVAEFGWELLRKAASLNAPTDVALTFADYISKDNRSARRFEQLTEETIQFISEIERVACAPVSLIATRFQYRSIIDRRAWRS